MKSAKEQSDKSVAVPSSAAGAAEHCRRFPAVICGKEKTAAQLENAVLAALEDNNGVIVTHTDEMTGSALSLTFPEGGYDPAARIFHIDPPAVEAEVFIITAGREDLPAALTAKYALSACGFTSRMLMTQGSAGIKQLAELTGRLSRAAACIAVAGTDSTLPGIIAGLTDTPVTALPATVKSGDRLDSMMSLFGVLSSGRTGLTVVSTDDGIGAGFAAARIINSNLKNQ